MRLKPSRSSRPLCVFPSLTVYRPAPACLAWLCLLLPPAAPPAHAAARAAQCGMAATPIAELRAAGAPSIGRRVVLEAVVTADYTGADGFAGFFVQQADARRQHRPGISEGMFVYAPRAGMRAGDLVRLNGTVEDRSGQMQLRLSGTATVCARGLAVTPAVVTLPVEHAGALAAHESMLVRLPQTLTVSDTYELGRYGSVALSYGRLQIPTNVALPGAGARAQAAANALNRLTLDDGSSRQNPATVMHPAPGLSAANTLRAGDSVAGVQGVLEMRFGGWRVQPVPAAPPPRFLPANPRAGAPLRAAGSDLRVAAFNLQNYFNGDGKGGGFDDPANRGARTPAEFARQEAKLLAALRGLDADVIGLVEIENNGYDETSAIRRLAAMLGPEWRFVDPGGVSLGGDAIAVGLLYNSRTVQVAGMPATLWFGERNRQPLAATFRLHAQARQLTVVVNHFKSKRCTDARGADADQDDGQACWNTTRVAAAMRLANWLATAPTAVADHGKLLIGDLNSYAREDPIRMLAQRGYADMIARFASGPAYSFVFGGEAGYLDHALADDAAASRIRAVHHWHVNADEPVALAYPLASKSTAQQQAFYAADAYRSSDHDPVLVDLAMRGDATLPGGVEPAGESGETGTPAGGSARPADGGGGGGAMEHWLAMALAGAAWLARRR
ncbi:ExeM/NucH family extracellular endonuclease [Cupriavidus sp. 2TAF22]|uniref:ExeM/NucH family extracellular endonuclease n=2 Tax=Cupriavidus TaxID=106589 RepID=UPI003F91D437